MDTPPASVEQYTHVQLDEDETAEALRRAREEKHFLLKRIAYTQEINKPMDHLKFTADQLMEILRSVHTYNDKPFDFTNTNYMVVAYSLCQYFTGDPKFPGDLNKGLALFGPVGTGKTALMRAFSGNQVSSYRVKSVLEITEDYKEHGEGAVKHYKANAQGSRNNFGHATYGYCFDDVGTEEIPAQHYGEKKNVFAEILQIRSLNVPTNTTHMTSNIDAADMSKFYGSRVADRMREMFNVIVFTGIESFRK